MRAIAIHSAIAGAVLFAGAVPAAQAPTQAPVQSSTRAIAPDNSASGMPTAALKLPFGVGERAEYEVKYGGIRMGNGHMEVVGKETIRGRDVLHTRFHIRGGPFFFKVDDRLESWIDPETMSSLRFRQELNEGSRDRERTFEFYHDRRTFLEIGKDAEEPSVPNPLDDASFIYFVRTVPLEVGQEYSFNRYFRPDRNPVKVRVLRRERIKVPAGEFNAVVVQPIINAKGIFAEGGHAEVWLSDDDRRVVLQMKTRFAKISLSLHLKSYRPPTAPATQQDSLR